MIKNINVRFFTYCTNEELEIDTCEISESQFMRLLSKPLSHNANPQLKYERHTVFENGCSQICLTVPNEDYPHISNLEGV